jgi:hypothetical protein
MIPRPRDSEEYAVASTDLLSATKQRRRTVHTRLSVVIATALALGSTSAVLAESNGDGGAFDAGGFHGSGLGGGGFRGGGSDGGGVHRNGFQEAASADLPVLAALDSIGLHTITTVTTAIGIGMPVIASRSNPAVVTGDPVWASAASPQSAVNPRWAQWSLQTR